VLVRSYRPHPSRSTAPDWRSLAYFSICALVLFGFGIGGLRKAGETLLTSFRIALDLVS